MEFIRFLGIMDDAFVVDLSKTDYELFAQHFNPENQMTIINHMKSKSPFNGKSVQKAETFRANGNTVYKIKDYGRAMDFYNLSLASAPRNVEQFGYALANRSAVLFNLKNYKDCLLDIQNVFDSFYPSSNYYKMFIRKATCLFELKAFDEATTAIENARSNFKANKLRIPATSHTAILEKIVSVAERIRFGRKDQVNEEIEYEKSYVLPSLKNGENPKYINASSSVDIKTNSRKGRHVVATCDIKKGDVLFVEKAYCFTVLKTGGRSTNYCQNCLKYSLVCLPCATCAIFFYCSDACRETSWDKTHRWTCVGVRKNVLSNEMCLALHVLFRASQTGFKNVIQDETVFGNKVDNYPYLNTLVNHRDKGIVLDLSTAVYLVVYLLHETDFFQWLLEQPNRPDLSDDELVLTVGTYILKHLRQCLYNMNRICELHLCEDVLHAKVISVSLEDAAYGLYVSSALINHSCVPNTTECYEKDFKVVKATDNIKKGSEVTVSYIAEHYIETSTETRQMVLKERHGFTCACPACKGCRKLDILEAWLCPRCSGPAVEYCERRKAKCVHCGYKFKIKLYMKQEKVILHNFVKHSVTGDLHSLETMEHIMRQIYSSNHFMVLRIYSLLINYHLAHNNHKKSLDYYKLLLNTDTVLEDKAFLADWAKYIYLLAKYCKSLPNKQSWEYRQTYNAAKDGIDIIMNMIHIYTNQRCADTIYQIFTKYLNSEGPVQFQYLFGKQLFFKE